MHTSGEPDGDNRQRTDDGCIFAELILLGRLPDGRKHRGIEMPEPCAGLGGMDDTGRRHRFLYPKFRRGRGSTSEDVSHRGHALVDEIKDTQMSNDYNG